MFVSRANLRDRRISVAQLVPLVEEALMNSVNLRADVFFNVNGYVKTLLESDTL